VAKTEKWMPSVSLWNGPSLRNLHEIAGFSMLLRMEILKNGDSAFARTRTLVLEGRWLRCPKVDGNISTHLIP
jgi:hypothetical protein